MTIILADRLMLPHRHIITPQGDLRATGAASPGPAVPSDTASLIRPRANAAGQPEFQGYAWFGSHIDVANGFLQGEKVLFGYDSLGSGFPELLAGSDHPENNYSANPGAIYARTNGTTFLKSSGTGSTGWVQLSSWQLPPIRKSADESVSSSTTLQNDDHLVASVLASSTYIVELDLMYEAHSSGDLKCGFTTPTSSVLRWGSSSIFGSTAQSSWTGYTASALSFAELAFQIGGAGGGQTDNLSFGGNGSAYVLGLKLSGILVTAGTAGNIQFQWAQGTSSATATKVLQNSTMRLIKV